MQRLVLAMTPSSNGNEQNLRLMPFSLNHTVFILLHSSVNWQRCKCFQFPALIICFYSSFQLNKLCYNESMNYCYIILTHTHTHTSVFSLTPDLKLIFNAINQPHVLNSVFKLTGRDDVLHGLVSQTQLDHEAHQHRQPGRHPCC